MKQIFSNMKTFPLTKEGIEAAKKWKPWYMRKETYKVMLLAVGYVSVAVLTGSTEAMTAGMGSIEQAVTEAFKIKLTGL